MPPPVRDLFAELLLELRHHVVPSNMLSTADNIGNSRYDIRGISQLFAHLASVPAVGETMEFKRDSMTELLPPPPPPPPPPQCTAADNREHNAPVTIKLEEYSGVCRTDEACFESLRNCFDLEKETTIDSETKHLEVPLLDEGPTNNELAVIVSSETNCMEETILDVAPHENTIIDTFGYVEYADGLPDHWINISGLIHTCGWVLGGFLTNCLTA